jgi:hypothetical protein
MKTDKAQLALGLGFLGAFGAFWRWHSPREAPLTEEETEGYLEVISKLPLPEGHMEPIVESLRAWAAQDDGKPVLMLNLIRFHAENHTWPGAPEFDGTPREANFHYERSIMGLWLRNASYPVAGGEVQGRNLINVLSDQPPWDAAKMVRYPSRRRFLQLLSDPSYGPYEPYKFMSMDIDLVPVSDNVSVLSGWNLPLQNIPDFRWAFGAALLGVYLTVGWARAVQR